MNRRNFMLGGIVAGTLCVFPALAQTNGFDLKQTTSDIMQILYDYLFEGNDSMTRREISVKVNEYLRGKTGLRSYDVVSNEQNNTPDTVDSGLIVDVYLLPDNTDTSVKYEFRVTTVGVVMITWD